MTKYRIIKVKEPYLAPTFYLERRLWCGIWYYVSDYETEEDARAGLDRRLNPPRTICEVIWQSE